MKAVLNTKYFFIFLFLIFTLNSVSAETDVATMNTYWTLTGEITNLYPYSVFITIPEEIEYQTKDLKVSKNFIKLKNGEETDDDEEETSTDPVTFDISPTSELNGKNGFWLSPYTTAKFKMYSNRTDVLTTDETDEEDDEEDGIVRTMDIAGPSAYPKTKVIDLKELIPASKKQGIKLDNFKLYVRGSVKKEDTEVMSVVIPAPIVLKDYGSCDKFISKYSVNKWVDSYSGWVGGHNEISNYGSALLDNSLIPEFDYGITYYKTFDVPALVYTTSSNKEFDFSYKMYWYDEYQDSKIEWI